jgi:hypothetical protein
VSTNKDKQNLRFKKVSERLNKKVRYDSFTPDEVKLIKAKKQYTQIERELNRFWATAPRLENNNVDWNNIDEQTLNYFEYINKQSEKLIKRISKLEDKGLDSDKIMNMFMLLNINSISY